ncbi:hypothetical protein [Flavobacterium sp. JSWR-1]
METNNTSKIPDDVIYHLELILNDLHRLKIDYNRDPRIVYASDFLIKRVNLVAEIYFDLNKKSFLALRNHLNSIFKEEPNTLGVIVRIENSKCNSEATSVKYFTQII